MSLTINTNTMSLNAQRNLSKSGSSLSTAMERLSSGLRINSAADDAAGLAISSRMSTQISGLTQAARNANDGISLAQTAEGALSEVESNLQRIRELAVQAANATNSDSDRAALDQEVQQRLEEINRIATQTSFNGRKVLDGSFGSATFQVGANVGETIGIALNTSMKTTAMGSLATAESGSTSGLFDSVTLAANDLTVQLASGAAVSVAAGTYTSASDLATAINEAAATAGFAGDIATVSSGGEITLTNNETTAGDTLTMAGAGATALGIATTAIAINGGTTDSTAVASSLDGLTLAAGALTLAVGDGTAVDLAGDYATAQDLADAINSKVSGAVATVNTDGNLSISSTDDLTIGGTNTSLGFTTGTTVASGNLTTVNVLTADDANDAIQRIDAALTSVNELSGILGAIQNRFQSAINSTEATNENLTAARSRIQDADFAQETSNMTSAQILQQAGVSVLAQANSVQQNILKLLQ